MKSKVEDLKNMTKFQMIKFLELNDIIPDERCSCEDLEALIRDSDLINEK